tara:strand:- start:160 stop:267 length:108 start_codon:yes stop_codon:yes gene_type:complete
MVVAEAEVLVEPLVHLAEQQHKVEEQDLVHQELPV